MGWVATVASSGFYYAAKSFYLQNGWKHPMSPLPNAKRVNVEDFDFVGSCGKRICIYGMNFTSEKEEWEFTILNVDDD